MTLKRHKNRSNSSNGHISPEGGQVEKDKSPNPPQTQHLEHKNTNSLFFKFHQVGKRRKEEEEKKNNSLITFFLSTCARQRGEKGAWRETLPPARLQERERTTSRV